MVPATRHSNKIPGRLHKNDTVSGFPVARYNIAMAASDWISAMHKQVKTPKWNIGFERLLASLFNISTSIVPTEPKQLRTTHVAKDSRALHSKGRPVGGAKGVTDES
jgi:lysozyme family protein